MKFDAEFIERRMREHRQIQQLALDVIVEGAVADVAQLLVAGGVHARGFMRVHRRLLPLRSSPRLSPREGQSGETD